MPFTNPVSCKMVRGATEHFKSFVVLLLVPDLRVGDSVFELGELYAMGLIGPPTSKSQVAALNC